MTQKLIKIIKTITTMGEDKRRRARLRREDERRRARLLRHMRARRTRFLAVCIFIIEDNFRDSLTDEQKQRRQRNLPRSALSRSFSLAMDGIVQIWRRPTIDNNNNWF